jgi:hypothetical protein
MVVTWFCAGGQVHTYVTFCTLSWGEQSIFPRSHVALPKEQKHIRVRREERDEIK